MNTRYPADFESYAQQVIDRVQPYTMTIPERIYTLIKAVEYVVEHNVPGDVVECGVWRGGSMMAVALTLLRLGDTGRHLYLFDTYEGMPEPSDRDVSPFGRLGRQDWEANRTDSSINLFCYASLEEVKHAMASTGYPQDKLHFIKGKVEDTIPGTEPERIALLRLDTDWYESSLHEMEHLYPKLSVKGVLIADDYGYWQGQKDATDEYLKKHNIPLLLTRVDFCCRMGVKVTESRG